MGNIDVRFYLSLFFRRIHYFLAIVALVSAAGVTVAYLLPPTYRANARILVESPQIPTDLARSTVSAEILKQLQIVELRLMTRANLLALAERLNLYRNLPEASEDDIVDDMRSRMSVDQMQFDVPRGRDAALAFTVSYKASQGELAANIVNEFVKLLIQKNTELRTEQASETLQFFQHETDRLSAKLVQIEGEISSFKKDNRDALPEGLSFHYSQQLNLQDRLMQLGREEASLRDGRLRLLQMYNSTGRVGSAVKGVEEVTLDQLRKVLIEQRTIYSDSSPGIVALQKQIAALEKAAAAKKTSDAKSGESEEKPLPAELSMQLSEIDRRLELIVDDKATIERNLSSINRAIAATPANEAVLNSLERQYQNIQTQYNVAVSRLADASTGDRIEQRSKGERLSVLDWALPPQHPIGPKRLVIAAGSIVASIMLGFGLILALEFLNKTIRRPSELVETLEIEPLETIPYIPVRGQPPSGGLRLIPTAFRRASGM